MNSRRIRWSRMPTLEAKRLRRAFAFAAALLCAGCAHGVRVQTDVLRVAVTSAPKTLNPLLATTTDEAFIAGLYLQPLLAFDRRGDARAVLARTVPSLRNGGIAPDGRTIVYHLRRGVVWSDGVPVTARDVIVSASAVMNPRNDVAIRNGFDDIASLNAPNPWTVVVHLKRPDAAFLDEFFVPGDGGGYVLPAHLLARSASLNRAPFNVQPISDGPFIVRNWERGDRVVLRLNPRYTGSRPRLRGIDVVTVPDAQAAVLQLQSGGVEMLFNVSSGSYRLLRGLRSSGISALTYPVGGWDAIALNVTRPGLRDPAVRRALAQALDKPRLAMRATGGAERPATEDIDRDSWAFDPAVPAVAYNPQAARRVLAPLRLSLQLAFPTNSSEARMLAVEIQSELEAAGVDLRIKGYDPSLFWATYGQNGILEHSRFDLAIDQWATQYDPDDSMFVDCSQRPPAGVNETLYCNPRLDADERAALETFSRARRKTAYARIETILARDNPYIFICWQAIVVATRTNVHGLATTSLDDLDTSSANWRLLGRGGRAEVAVDGMSANHGADDAVFVVPEREVRAHAWGDATQFAFESEQLRRRM